MGTITELLLLSLVGLVSSQFTRPLLTLENIKISEGSGNSCSSECADEITDKNVMFSERVNYRYEFNGKTTVTAPTGTSDGISEVSIRGLANIIGKQKCGAILYLQNIQIIRGSKSYESNLEGQPILFSYNNGKVEQKICSSANDSVASINLKRAIISALQVSSVPKDLNENFETDIQGTCNTRYSVTPTSTYLTINKYKNLKQCTEHGKIDLLGLSPSQSEPVYESSPFLSAVQRSDIRIMESAITSVTNQEIYLYRPFGVIDAVTKITISMNMNLKGKSIVNVPSLNLDRTRSIIFEKPAPIIGSADMNNLVNAVRLTTKNLEPVVDVDGAKRYKDLITLLKVAKKDDILSAFRLIKNSGVPDNVKMTQKIFIDALITANNGKSIEAVAELFGNREISDALAASWFKNLANAKYPTREAVVLASNLLNQMRSKEGYIGVGALLRQYLKHTQDYNSREVENTLKNIGTPLMKSFNISLSSTEQNLVIASLKGLGNVQYINNNMEDLIVRVIKDRATIQRIRAMALIMVQNYAKNPKVEKTCENVFIDLSEDSELRILAFKVYAAYPSVNKAAVIKRVLEDRKGQLQIRAFLFSYLNGLENTIDENKKDQKRFYGKIKTMSSSRKLNDILRYSQNLEYSYQSPLLHSAVLLNGDVIYSYNSFLARSSSASLKASIFGCKLNVFDYDVRVENIESVLEKLFGPQGYFAKRKGHVFNDVKYYVNQAINYAKSRQYSDIDSKLSPENYNLKFSDKDMKNMYIDIALKAFGKDLGWFAFQGQENQISYQNLIDAILHKFNRSLPNKKNIKLDIKKQMPIIDYDMKYATSSGLPISLKIQVTSAMKLNLATKFDLDNYLSQSRNLDFALKLVPSGSVTLDTLFTIDGNNVEVGQKTSSTLHISTGSDFSLKTNHGVDFEIIYGLPLDVVDLFSFKSGAFKIVQEKGSSLIETPLSTTAIERKIYSRSFDKLKNLLGLSLNVQYDFPWDGKFKSLLPYSGPSSLSVKVLKLDPKLTKYILKGNYDFKSPTLKSIKLMFLTPKSDIDRGFEFYVAYDTNKDAKLITGFKTPSKKVQLENTLVNSDKRKSIDVHYTDGSSRSLSIGVNRENVDDKTIKYSPIFETVYTNLLNNKEEKQSLIPNYDIEGSVLVTHNLNSQNRYPSKLTLNNVMLVSPKGNHSLQGSVTIDKNEIKGDVSLTSGGIKFVSNGFINKDNSVYKMGASLDITNNGQKAELFSTISRNIDYKPIFKLMTSLNKVKSLKLSTFQEVHIKSPYVFISNNRVLLNNDKLEINGDFLVENKKLTLHGNISTSNLFGLMLNANIDILPSTLNTGRSVIGHFKHSLVSDPSNIGKAELKYILDGDKKGSSLELNTECPQVLGVFNLNTKYHLTDKSYIYNFNYNTRDGTSFKVETNIVPNDIKFNVNLYSANIKYKSYLILHGWSEKNNTYAFNSKLLWPGSQNLNYINADGNIILNGLYSSMNGNIDFPLVKLKNVHVSLENTPNTKVQDGSIATVRCVNNDRVILFEKLKYRFLLNNGELYISGETDKDSLNLKPINFLVEYKNYLDEKSNVGKKFIYKIEFEQNGKKLKYQKLIQATKQALTYRQLKQVDDDEQTISLDLEHDFLNAWNWSYNLKLTIVSPSVFHYFMHNDNNLLELDSHVKLNGYSLDKGHSLKIYSSEGLTNSYEVRYFINKKKTALQVVHGPREIRGLAYYEWNSIDGGYNFTYSGELWLDYITDPNSVSTLSLETFYSINNGLSTATNFSVFVPLFVDKEMRLKSDIRVSKSWENPLRAQLDLDIFPTTEQTIQLQTNLNRNIQDDGILYSAEIIARSEGMELEYSLKDSILISKNKWGIYLDVYFIDSNYVKRPIQMHFELVPKGFTNKINIFDITVISVNCSIGVKNGDLSTRSTINYNNHPYIIGLSLTKYPSLKYTIGWKDKLGRVDRLELDGSVTFNDSATIRATRFKNNGESVIPMGYVKKSLQKHDWWTTNNQMKRDQWNIILLSLRGQFIERSIDVHSNIRNIISVAEKQHNLYTREIKKAKPQYHALKEYTFNELKQIWKEVRVDDYLLKILNLTINTTKAVLSTFVDLIEHMNLKDLFKNLRKNIKNYLQEKLKHFWNKINLLYKAILRGYNKFFNQVRHNCLKLFNLLNMFMDKSMKIIMSINPKLIEEYINGVINKLTNLAKKFQNGINNIRNMFKKFTKNLPIYSYDMFKNKIKKLKSYPYKAKLWEKIHKCLHKLEVTSPTKDIALFINALDKYINKIIHNTPIPKRDMVILKTRGLIAAKSMKNSLSDYVDYNKAMSVYNALLKLKNINKPNSYKVTTKSLNPQNMLNSISEYGQLYHKYLKPSNLLPPYKTQSVIISYTNIITYNSLAYSFRPQTGSYILAKDFVNNKFSIFANYNNNTLTSISVSSKNEETYVLLPGGKVSINNKFVDFPLINDNVKIWKDVYFFGIDNPIGISIKSSINLDIVKVFIDGYYYGKVFGLLGTIQQEPTFDFKLPNGKLPDSLNSFLSTYKSAGHSIPSAISYTSNHQLPCSILFSKNSTLKSAFSTISPTPYKLVCNQLVSSAISRQDGMDKACLVVKAYVSMARYNFVPNCNIPDECIRTILNKRSLNTRANTELTDVGNAVDIIILFEETEDYRQHFSNLLKPFVKIITKHLNNKGINDVNFIFMGYSEKRGNSDVHIYTTNEDKNYSEILNNVPEWSTSSDIHTAGLTSRFIQTYKKVIGESSKHKAYKLSAEYPFRANAVKTVVSVTKNLYAKSYLDISLYTFKYVTSCYAEQGIKFYLIAPINLHDHSDDEIFGSRGTTTIYSMSEPNGKKINTKYVYDKSLETELALKTNGAMYNIQSFIDGTEGQREIFLNSLGKTIIDNVIKDSMVVKTCSSSLYDGVMPYTKCIVVKS